MTITIKIIQLVNRELKLFWTNNISFIIYKLILHNQDFVIKIKLC